MQGHTGRAVGEGFAGKQWRRQRRGARGQEVTAAHRHQLLPLYLAASAFSFSGSIHQDSVSAPI